MLQKGPPVQQFTGFVNSRLLCPNFFGEPKQSTSEAFCPIRPTFVHRANSRSHPLHSLPREEEVTMRSEKLNYSHSRSPAVISFGFHCIFKIILLFALKLLFGFSDLTVRNILSRCFKYNNQIRMVTWEI